MAEGERNESLTHKQHPIPQNVLGVEFKLVGGLTLRQFLFLSVFLIIAFIIFQSNLPGLIKTPTAAVLALLGAFISLVPIQDRSADVWLKNFLVAVTSPTERLWQKGSANLDVFWQLREAKSLIRETKEFGTPRVRAEVLEYIRGQKEIEENPQDLAESEFLKSIKLLQNEIAPPAPLSDGGGPLKTPVLESYQPFKARAEVTLTENLASEVNFSQEKVFSLPSSGGYRPKFFTPIQNTRAGRPLRLTLPARPAVRGEKVILAPTGVAETAQKLVQKIAEVDAKIEAAKLAKNPTETHEAPPPLPGRDAGQMATLAEELNELKRDKEALEQEVARQKKARAEAETLASLAAEQQRHTGELAAQNVRLANEMKKAQDDLRHWRQQTASAATDKEVLLKQVRGNEKRIEELAREKSQTTDNLINLQKELREMRLHQKFAVSATLPPPGRQPGQLFAKQDARPKDLAAPFIKDRPNVINGYVRGKDRNLIKSAVVIVKDPKGSPVRALKTNDLGQFAITTPVPNGVYSVEVSGQGETFGIMTLEAFGSVLEPLEFVGI